MPYCGYMGGGWMLLSWIIGIAALAGLVWLGIYLAQRSGTLSEAPEKILKQRYARGEIDGEAYHRMLDEVRR